MGGREERELTRWVDGWACRVLVLRCVVVRLEVYLIGPGGG